MWQEKTAPIMDEGILSTPTGWCDLFEGPSAFIEQQIVAAYEVTNSAQWHWLTCLINLACLKSGCELLSLLNEQSRFNFTGISRLRCEISNAIRKLIKMTPFTRITLLYQEWKIETLPIVLLWNASHLKNVLSLRPCQRNIFILSSWIFDEFWWRSNAPGGEEISKIFLQEPTKQLTMFSSKVANCPDFIEPWVIRFILKFRAPGIWWWCNSASVLKPRGKREIPGLVVRANSEMWFQWTCTIKTWKKLEAHLETLRGFGLFWEVTLGL